MANQTLGAFLDIDPNAIHIKRRDRNPNEPDPLREAEEQLLAIPKTISSEPSPATVTATPSFKTRSSAQTPTSK